MMVLARSAISPSDSAKAERLLVCSLLVIRIALKLPRLDKSFFTPSVLLPQLMKRNCYQVFMYGSNLEKERLSNRTHSWNGQFQRAYLPGYELRFNKRLQRGE